MTWTVAAPDADDVVEVVARRVIAPVLERCELADLAVADCDVGGVVTSNATFRRLDVRRTRIRDSVCATAMVQDVVVSECQVDGASLRFSTLQRVVFSDCRLVGLDCYGARFDRVRFERCDLSGADFTGVDVRVLDFRECNLLGVIGASALRGATVDLEDLAALAPSLAREAGLVVRVSEVSDSPGSDSA